MSTMAQLAISLWILCAWSTVSTFLCAFAPRPAMLSVKFWSIIAVVCGYMGTVISIIAVWQL